MSELLPKQKGLLQIWKELKRGFKNNPDNLATFDTMANMLPPLAVYRGGQTLSDVPEKFQKGQYKDAAIDTALGGLDVVGGLMPMMGTMRMASSALPKGVPLKQAGMFIGEKAKTFNHEALKQAKEMEKLGEAPRKIWAETGNWKAVDGKWRQEIPDDLVKWQPTPEFMTGKGLSLQHQIMPHEDLSAAYSGIGDIAVKKSAHGGGSYSPTLINGKLAQEDILIGAPAVRNVGNGYSVSSDAGKSINLHELQHAIQQREGWARGGSPETAFDFGNGAKARDEQFAFAKQAYEEAHKSSGDQLLAELFSDVKPWERLTDREKLGWLDQGRNIAYNRLAGEAEARATQSRMNLTMPERLAKFPEDSFDVPQSDLIVRYGDGPAMNMPQRPVNALGQEIPPTQYELAQEAARIDAWKNHGLPENNTAMDRARAMGRDMDVYHGTRTEGIKALDPDMAKYAREGAGTWLTPNTERANSYAGTLGGYVMPLKIDPRDMARMDFEGRNWASAPEKQPIFNATGKKSYPSKFFDDPYDLTTNDYSVMAKARGNSGLIIDNVKDAGGYGSGVNAANMPATGTSIALHDPTKARSRFAAFNMSNRDSADLLASYLLPTATTGALGYSLLTPNESWAR